MLKAYTDGVQEHQPAIFTILHDRFAAMLIACDYILITAVWQRRDLQHFLDDPAEEVLRNDPLFGFARSGVRSYADCTASLPV